MSSSRIAAYYHNPSNVGAYRGAYRLWKSLQKTQNPPTLHEVKNWLKGREEYTLHKTPRKVTERLHFISPHERHTLQADLMDVSSSAVSNEGVRFLLTTVDIFSGLAEVFPLKSKTGTEVAAALSQVLQKGYLFLHTDKGTEFYNRSVSALVKRLGITHYSTENDNIKAGIVERFNRTLREVLARYMEHKRTNRYIDALPQLIESHNKTPNSRTGIAPIDVKNHDVQKLWIEKFESPSLDSRTPKFKVGEHVRLVGTRRVFTRGYHEQWTREVFVIESVDTSSVPVTYRVRDLLNEKIKGRFYGKELQSVTYDEDGIFQIEKVLKRRKVRNKTELFVKWKGYPDKFNSWIDANGL